MNTNAIIGLVVAVIVIGGGAWYVSSHTGAPGTGAEVQGMGEQKAESGTLSFKELMLMGGSRKCDVSVTTPEAPATGTVYVSGGNVRSDIVTKPKAMNGAAVSAHMIRSGDYLYSWTDLIAQGVKVKIDAAESAGKNAGYDANAEVQYSCAAWIADESMFAVPSNITFMDFSAAASGQMPAGYPKP